MFAQEEFAGGGGDFQYGAGLGLVVQPSRGTTMRLALDRDAVAFAIRRRRDRIVALDRRMSGNLEPEGKILTRPIRHHRTAIDRTTDEGVDHAAFEDALLHPEITTAVPSPGRILLFGIDEVFAGHKALGEKPMSLPPGGEN